MYKICILCKEQLLESEINFRKRSDNKKFDNKCRECSNEERRIYYKENREYLLNDKKNYYKNNKDEINKKKKIYYQENKESSNRRKNEWEKNKYERDPVYKFMRRVSKSVNNAFRANFSSKSGRSFWDNINYTKEEFKSHIESLFESWMNWRNHGIYDSKTWNDNDPSTWKWQLDHIQPQKNFPFKDFSDENFKKCWALSNLRPYSAKQNILDGARLPRNKK